HVDAEPVGLDPARVVLDTERGDEHDAGAQPASDPGEQRRVLITRDMGQRIEGDHGVEAGRRAVDRRHVGLDERRRWNVGASQRDLRPGDVDAHETAADREGRRNRDAGAKAQLADVWYPRETLTVEGQGPPTV